MTRHRPEVDGLRAIALLPVLLFHAGLPAFSGGYLGVDVFFVMSGYLITALILAEHRDGSFGLLKFYERRARRILPALFLAMLLCIPAAWFWMLPDDLENFGQSLFATTFFGNNLLLWLTSGYFAAAVEFKPLAHTWSLGLEEQFYLLFPLLLALLLRKRPGWLAPALVAGIVASLCAGFWSAGTYGSDNYLFGVPRAWELLAGGLLAISEQGRRIHERAPAWAAGMLGLVGLVVIGIAIATPGPTNRFPTSALPATAGTLLVLAFSDSGNVAGRLLALRPLVLIGLVSYSAYLWHQPLFAFARILSLQEPGPPTFLALAIVAIVMAWISWKWVETPFRRREAIGSRTFIATAVSTALVLASAGLAMHFSGGAPGRWPLLASPGFGYGHDTNADFNRAPYRYLDQAFDDSKALRILVLGNSFARDFINAARANGRFSTASISYSEEYPDCLHGAADIAPLLSQRLQRADYVIFGSPDFHLDCWASDLGIWRRLSHGKIIVIGSKYFSWNLNAVFQLPEAQRQRYRAPISRELFEQNRRDAATIGVDRFVDLLALLSRPDGRVPIFTDDGKLISQDGRHLTPPGARYLGRMLFNHPLLAEIP